MRFFETPKVIALMSDKSIDFTPADFDSSLLPAQMDYLKKETGVHIPHVFWRKQVHGDNILVAKDSSKSSCGAPDADAVITCQKNLPIAIRTADCVPVFLYDSTKSAIGLAHAGWKGTHQEIASKTVLRMKDAFGCKSEDIQVVLGPSIQPCCYEVGSEFSQYFPNEIIERSDKFYVDVTKANYRQLLKVGIKKENINSTGICTCCHSKYFSFRREADKAGRMISLMVLV